MRILGAVLIMSAFVYGGFSASRALNMRLLFWEGFLTALEILRAEICFAHSDVKRAFEAAAGVSGQEIFAEAAKSIERLGLDAAWESAVEECALAETDKAVLRMLASKLGKTDEAGQVRHIDYVVSRAGQIRDEAERDYAKRGTLFRRGAVLVGVFVVLALL